MNIKNEQTHALVRELAELTGESLTETVTVAVQERLDRLQRAAVDGRATVAELLAIGRDTHRRLVEPWRSGDIDDLLYDDRGLPR